MKKSTSISKFCGGYITLISVLIVGAVAIAASTSVILSGVASSKSSFALEQSNKAKALVNACIEEGLQQIRDNAAFAGSGNLSLGSGSCVYSVTSQGGQARTVMATSTVGTVIRKVEAVVTGINPRIILSAWQEVSD